MTQEIVAVLLDESRLTIDELAASCVVSREWIVEHVQAGVLPVEPPQEEAEPERWLFSGHGLQRTRRLMDIEKSFDANPELAGLVADLFDELDRLRTRLRRAGLRVD